MYKKINCRYGRIFWIFFIGALIRSIEVQYKYQTMNAAFEKTEKVFNLKLHYWLLILGTIQGF